MSGWSQTSVFLAEIVLVSLVALGVLRAFSLRKNGEREWSPASLVAAGFGVVAVLSLGVFIPLEILDEPLGGSNLTNLLQSLLTVCAFWFFRVAVMETVFPAPQSYRLPFLALSLALITVAFFFIEDRGPTSAQFMAEHADQLANVSYNTVYMTVLGWVVFDMFWALRQEERAYQVFRVGLLLVLASCVDEILYVTLAYAAPGPVAQALYHSFYALFFGGILIVAAGWFWVIVTERGYPHGAIWRIRSITLVPVLIRARKLARKAATDPEPVHVIHQPEATLLEGPRLKVNRYVAPRSSSTLSSMPAESAWTIIRTFFGPSSEDVAYRLLVQIRNTETRHGINLSPSDATKVREAETRFPGLAAVC